MHIKGMNRPRGMRKQFGCFLVKPPFFALLVLLSAAVFSVGCDPVMPGVWDISGTDTKLGDYTGTLEIRADSSGGYEVIRLTHLFDVTREDGRIVETAWTGKVTRGSKAPWILDFSLTRADFIPRLGELERTDQDKDPVEVMAVVTPLAGNGLRIDYSEAGQTTNVPRITEQAVYSGPPGEEPIFRSDRATLPAHKAPGPVVKAALFKYFATFHQLAALQAYLNDPAFKEAVHYQIVDHTDFEYYREHPDRIRVVNKVVDPISLAETEIRANAFRARFVDKADHYQNIMDSGLLAPYGMVLSRLPPGGEEQPDGDGNLWTGVYAWTQALRYKHTGEAAALDNLRKALTGILTTMDITVTVDPRAFARTLRLADPALGDRWQHGQGEYAHLDWMAGGNNDMSQGLLLGMVAGWEALPEGDPLRQDISVHAMALLDLCEFLDERPEECGKGDSDLGLPSLNPGLAKLLAGIANDRSDLVADGLDWVRNPIFTIYSKIGGGPIYVFGISDWSGNHLTLATNVVLEWALSKTRARKLEERWLAASAVAWKVLRNVDMPLHAAKAAATGIFEDPAEREQAVQQALWGLRSFPFPKHPYPVDHRIRGGFVMSPFPSLPWKNDWTTNPGRQQALVGHGMLESVVDGYRWNGSPVDIASGGNGDNVMPGVDYLFLYWIARDGGLISALD